MGSGGVGQSLVPWDRVLCVACRQLPRSAATGGAPPGNHAIVVRSTPRPRGFRTVRAAGPRLILFLVSPRWAATRRPACSPLGEGVSPLSRCRNCGCRRCRGLPPVERAHGLAAPRGTCTAASTAIYVRGGGGGAGERLVDGGTASSHLPLPRSTCVPGLPTTFGSGCFSVGGPCDSLGTCTYRGDCSGRLSWGSASRSLYPGYPLGLAHPAPATPRLPPSLLTPHWLRPKHRQSREIQASLLSAPHVPLRRGANRSARAVSLRRGEQVRQLGSTAWWSPQQSVSPTPPCACS